MIVKIEPRNILVIRLGGIGDILFTLPAINLLKDNFANCHLSYLTKKAFLPIIKGFPAVDEVIAYDSDGFNNRNPIRKFQTAISLFQKLHQADYQLIIDFHGLGKTALIGSLTGAKERWGIIRKKISKPFYTYSQPIIPNIHRIDLNRLLLENVGLNQYSVKNSFVLPQIDFQKGLNLWKELGLSFEQPTLFIQPFTNFENKNWPLENYLAVAHYCKSHNVQVIFGGGPKDSKALHHVAIDFPVTAGRADFLTTASLMKLSTLILGGDTGMLHLAVALDKKVIMLMNGTGYQRFYPYQHQNWAIIPKSSFNIEDIEIETVKSLISESFHI